ncbi:MAG: Asp-tRNA(Asn)/Glu-tRNA(Gln) amidotransferase subunit GatC [Anaerolineales bacterium]|nr:Asp-tRNA(Asn)/Glu-tRNA(Gln) amidotransferase subunit GatC [Anaerolineales bacterium]
MTDEITPEIFQHLVDLAALELDPEETDYLRKELNGQLKAISELEAIEVDNMIEITSHGVPYTKAIRPPLREDMIKPFANPEAILAQAPEVEENYIVVPVIPHTELE